MSAKIFPLYNNFKGGEISPACLCRTDLEIRNNSCYELENMIVRLQGGAFRRPGTIFVNEAKYTSKLCRLVPYETPLLAPYMIEMGDQYMRFFRRGIPVCTQGTTNLVTNGTFPTDLTGWTDLSTGTGSTTWTAGQMNLLAGATGVAARQQGITTTPGAWYRLHFEAVNHPLQVKVGTVSGLNGRDTISGLAGTVPAIGSYYVDFRAGFTTTYIMFYNATDNDAAVANVSMYLLTPYEISTPYLEADLQELDIRMHSDGMRIYHQHYAPRILTTAADDNWTLALQSFIHGPFIATNIVGVISYNADSGTVTLTAASPTWTADDVGALWKFHFDPDDGWGSAKITGYTSSTVVTALIHDSWPDHDANHIHAAREGCWSDVRGWPQAGGFFEDRQIFVATEFEPQTIWGSASPDPETPITKYIDFKIGPLDSDAFYYELGGNSPQADVIHTLMPLDVLLLATASGEFVMSGGANGPITPTNVLLKPQTTVGSAKRTPIRVGNSVVLMESTMMKLRGFSFQWEANQYNALDLNFWADHITAGGMTCYAFQKAPDSIIWSAREDGMLLSCTLDPGQAMIAWARHPVGGTDAEVESVAVSRKAIDTPAWETA